MKMQLPPLPVLLFPCVLLIFACGSSRRLEQGGEDWLGEAEQQALIKRYPAPNYAEKLNILTHFPINQNPAGAGPSGMPLRMTLGPNGLLYVSESDDPQVRVFDLNGGALRRIGTRGRGRGEFLEPTLLGFAPNDQLVVWDSRALRFQIFGSQGDFVSSFRLFMPCSSMSVDSRAYIYLSFLDAVSNDKPLIDFYDLSGRHLGQFGSRIQVSSPFFNEVDLSITDDGILAAWKTYPLIRKYSKAGELLFEHKIDYGLLGHFGRMNMSAKEGAQGTAFQTAVWRIFGERDAYYLLIGYPRLEILKIDLSGNIKRALWDNAPKGLFVSDFLIMRDGNKARIYILEQRPVPGIRYYEVGEL